MNNTIKIFLLFSVSVAFAAYQTPGAAEVRRKRMMVLGAPQAALDAELRAHHEERYGPIYERPSPTEYNQRVRGPRMRSDDEVLAMANQMTQNSECGPRMRDPEQAIALVNELFSNQVDQATAHPPQVNTAGAYAAVVDNVDSLPSLNCQLKQKMDEVKALMDCVQSVNLDARNRQKVQNFYAQSLICFEDKDLSMLTKLYYWINGIVKPQAVTDPAVVHPVGQACAALRTPNSAAVSVTVEDIHRLVVYARLEEKCRDSMDIIQDLYKQACDGDISVSSAYEFINDAIKAVSATPKEKGDSEAVLSHPTMKDITQALKKAADRGVYRSHIAKFHKMILMHTSAQDAEMMRKRYQEALDMRNPDSPDSNDEEPTETVLSSYESLMMQKIKALAEDARRANKYDLIQFYYEAALGGDPSVELCEVLQVMQKELGIVNSTPVNSAPDQAPTASRTPYCPVVVTKKGPTMAEISVLLNEAESSGADFVKVEKLRHRGFLTAENDVSGMRALLAEVQQLRDDCATPTASRASDFATVLDHPTKDDIEKVLRQADSAGVNWSKIARVNDAVLRVPEGAVNMMRQLYAEAEQLLTSQPQPVASQNTAGHCEEPTATSRTPDSAAVVDHPTIEDVRKVVDYPTLGEVSKLAKYARSIGKLNKYISALHIEASGYWREGAYTKLQKVYLLMHEDIFGAAGNCTTPTASRRVDSVSAVENPAIAQLIAPDSAVVVQDQEDDQRLADDIRNSIDFQVGYAKMMGKDSTKFTALQREAHACNDNQIEKLKKLYSCAQKEKHRMLSLCSQASDDEQSLSLDQQPVSYDAPPLSLDQQPVSYDMPPLSLRPQALVPLPPQASDDAQPLSLRPQALANLPTEAASAGLDVVTRYHQFGIFKKNPNFEDVEVLMQYARATGQNQGVVAVLYRLVNQDREVGYMGLLKQKYEEIVKQLRVQQLCDSKNNTSQSQPALKTPSASRACSPARVVRQEERTNKDNPHLVVRDMSYDDVQSGQLQALALAMGPKASVLQLSPQDAVNGFQVIKQFRLHHSCEFGENPTFKNLSDLAAYALAIGQYSGMIEKSYGAAQQYNKAGNTPMLRGCYQTMLRRLYVKKAELFESAPKPVGSTTPV